MQRKVTCAILAACLALTSLVTVFAAGADKNYSEALEALSASGISSATSIAMNGGAMQAPIELGMLKEGNSLSLTELSTAVLQRRQENQLAQEEAVVEAAANAAVLVQYDGVIITAERSDLYESTEEDAEVIRSLPAGKVAMLLDLQDGLYQVEFCEQVGYLSAEDCEPVHYDEYAGTSATNTLVEDLIEYAYTYLGTPYMYGGTSRRGIDCSAFTMQVFAHIGYSIPRVVSGQYRASTRVSGELQPGDLLFFNTTGSGFGHVGIYLGDGMFIHAGSITGVAVRSLSESYFARTYICAGRVID